MTDYRGPPVGSSASVQPSSSSPENQQAVSQSENHESQTSAKDSRITSDQPDSKTLNASTNISDEGQDTSPKIDEPPCTQAPTRRQSDDAKSKYVLAGQNLSGTTERAVGSSEDGKEGKSRVASVGGGGEKSEKFDNAKSKDVQRMSLSSTVHSKTDSKLSSPSSAEQMDTDSDEEDSKEKLESHSGYEQISKTILRKSDTVVRSAEHGSKMKGIKKDFDTDRVQLQVAEDQEMEAQDKKNRILSDTPTESELITDEEANLDRPGLKKQEKNQQFKCDTISQDVSTQPSSKIKRKERSSSPEIQSSGIVGKNAAERKETSRTFFKKSRNKASKSSAEADRSASPIEERVSNTVIRRHIKAKPTTQADTKSSTLSKAGKGSALSDEQSAKSQPVIPKKDPECSESQRKQTPVTSAKEGSSSNMNVQSSGKKTMKDESKTLIEVQRSPVIMRSARVEEIPLKEAGIESSKVSKTITVEPMGSEEIQTSLGSSTSKATTSGIKRVSIKEPPESIPCKDSEIVAQGSKKSSSKSTFARVIAGTSRQSRGKKKATDSKAEEKEKEKEKKSKNKKQTNGQGTPKNKSCCFCWCCCCSCSCLAVNNQNQNETLEQLQPLPGSLQNYFAGEEKQPTVEEIRSWGESFDKLMKSSAGRKLFREFLQCEYSEENMLFWLACEDLKKEKSKTVIEQKAKKIYEEFISILSPREVSLDSRVRDIVNRNMLSPTNSTFDEAQLQIYTLMHRDSYPRFVNSSNFRQLARLPAPSRKGSMA